VPVEREVHGGVVGVVLDGRGRPIQPPDDPDQRRRAVTQWHTALDCYPDTTAPTQQA